MTWTGLRRTEEVAHLHSNRGSPSPGLPRVAIPTTSQPAVIELRPVSPAGGDSSAATHLEGDPFQTRPAIRRQGPVRPRAARRAAHRGAAGRGLARPGARGTRAESRVTADTGQHGDTRPASEATWACSGTCRRASRITGMQGRLGTHVRFLPSAHGGAAQLPACCPEGRRGDAEGWHGGDVTVRWARRGRR